MQRRQLTETLRAQKEDVTQRSLVTQLRWVLPPDTKIAAILNEAKGVRPKADTETPEQFGRRRSRYVMARRAQGALPGITDLVIACPASVSFWMEVKRPVNGVLSSDQQDVRDDLLALGHFWGVAYDLDTAVYALQQAPIRLRNLTGIVPRPAVVRLEKRKPRMVEVVGQFGIRRGYNS